MRSMIHESQTLIAHPACEGPNLWRVSVAFEREGRGGGLNIRYRLPRFGLRLPQRRSPPDLPARVDGLWRHSCAELFVGVPGNAAYREFNFSADGCWAAYDFVDYRIAAARLPQIVAPKISSAVVDDGFCIDVELEASALPDSDEAQFSATVVLESEDGHLSYWAAFHPCAKPDFHHRDGFVLTLA